MIKNILPLNVGFGNFVVAERIIAVVDPLSSPVKQLIQEARKKGMLLNAAKGKKTRSAIFLDNGTVVLSTLSPQAIARRLEEFNQLLDKNVAETPSKDSGE